MEVSVRPGARIGGEAVVPGDKSIAHRWLILAACGDGTSELGEVPPSLDVASTARCLAALAPEARAELERWAEGARGWGKADGFTANNAHPRRRAPALKVRGGGWASLEGSRHPLDCGNSGTSLRLLAGIACGSTFETVLTGDESLRRRPMERIARPLRHMGAEVGGPVTVEPNRVSVRAFQPPAFAAAVPGDVSSAAFLVSAAAITGGELLVKDVGLNPSRTRFLDVLRRFGVRVEGRPRGSELGEPVGELFVRAAAALRGTLVPAEEVPLVIDEIPALAAIASHAEGETRFEGAAELRVKESDRLQGTARAIRGLGGHAEVHGEDLVIGGGGLEGGSATADLDHRMAMALAVAALGARGPSRIDGIESAEVSFPGFLEGLSRLGARIEVEG